MKCFPFICFIAIKQLRNTQLLSEFICLNYNSLASGVINKGHHLYKAQNYRGRKRMN